MQPYSYVFLDGDLVLREVPELLVLVLGQVQIPEGPAHLCRALTQTAVDGLQLLLSGQCGLHLLLMEALLFPGNDRCGFTTPVLLVGGAGAGLTVPVLLLAQFQSEAQDLLLVQSIIQPLLQLLHLQHTFTEPGRPPHSPPASRSAPTLDMCSAFMVSKSMLF